MSIVSRYADKQILQRIHRKVLKNIRPILTKSTIRKCGCCDRTSLFIQFGDISALQTCVLCTASFRYEVLGRHIRAHHSLRQLTVLELDPHSALRKLLSESAQHIQSYFRPDHSPGEVRADGAVMQDITRLTYADSSLDMIVSSDVLEHVPDAAAAFCETFRVLRPGGVHVFTIPEQPSTKRLAEVRDGAIHYMVTPPEYHSDPLDPKGILAFWHFGPDMQQWFGDSGLQFKRFSISDGPDRNAYVWEARKPLGI